MPKRGVPISREYRINDRIKAREVRLIGDAGEQIGTIPLYKALEMARDQGLDLVEVAPAAMPPVCRLLDYGKFKYEQAKKESEARKHQKNVQLREVRMKPKIDDHDVDVRVRTAEKLLKEGDKVKVTVMFRGREITHPQIGRDLLEQIYGRLKGIASVEKPASMEGRHMTMILVPGAAKPDKPVRAAVVAPPTEARTPAVVTPTAVTPPVEARTPVMQAAPQGQPQET